MNAPLSSTPAEPAAMASAPSTSPPAPRLLQQPPEPKLPSMAIAAVTSKCGSADVLEAMGVPVALTPQQSADCLRATGFTFLYAPALHPGHEARAARTPRASASAPSSISPARSPIPQAPPRKSWASTRGTRLDLAAGAMAQLGIRFGRVVHARNGIDEIALSPTDTIIVRAVSDHDAPQFPSPPSSIPKTSAWPMPSCPNSRGATRRKTTPPFSKPFSAVPRSDPDATSFSSTPPLRLKPSASPLT
jgi:hypothetical protein